MVTVRTCGYNGCGNPVKEGDTRCYLHRNSEAVSTDPFKASSVEEAAQIREQWESMRALTAIVSKRTVNVLTMNEKQAELIQIGNKLSLATAKKVADASEIINRRRPELEIPAFVAKNLRSIVTEFVRDLIESGISPDRISEMQMWGAKRRLGGGRIENSPDAGHLILVLDRGTDEQTALDAGISMFAPVSDPNKRVTDQIDTKFSPYGYAPLVTPLSSYTKPDYVWFANFKYVDRQNSENVASIRRSG